jgi:Subtilase family
MFTISSFPLSALTPVSLAVLSAFAPVRAQEAIPPAAVPIEAAQTYFPVAGTLDVERNNTLPVITSIKADAAYRIGITGKGVTVATMDTGISAGHREFLETGKLLPGFNAITGSNDVVDKVGHGTHVAGLIAGGRDGRGIFGVAFDANILPIKVLGDDGSGSTNYLDRGLRYAIGKASIVNMSLGAAGSYGPGAVQEAVRAGLLLVVAAGNDKAANPGWPARFAKEAWANNQIIAVGAVDASNTIASFSNRAGDTAAWYLVAPGVGILSSYLNDQYAYMSGTSMATPVVSGAAALIKQRWPTLRADQIANILFLTATDLGTPGIDPVYGRGLVNIEKAMQPIGIVTTTTYNGRTISVLAGSTRLSAATSKLWQLAASGQLQVIGIDDFQRDFHVDLGTTVARPAGMSIEQVFGSMDRRIEVAETVLSSGASLAVAYERRFTSPGIESRSPHARLAAFALTTKDASGREAAIGVGGLAAQYFGVGGLPLSQEFALASVPALANPYFSLVPAASHAAVGQDIAGFRFKFGMLSTGFNQTMGSQDIALPTSISTVAAPRANAGLFEMSKSFGNAALSVSLSKTRESNAYLGAQSNGAIGLAPNASTRSVQFAGAVLLTSKLALAGQAAYGMTPGGNGSNLVTEVTQARTNAFSIGLIASDSIKPGDRFSLTLSQPMRTYAGRMAMDMLTGTGADGAPTRQRLDFSMVPLGREMRAEMNYHAKVGRDGSMGITLMLRRDPDNLIDAPADKLLAWRFVQAF